MSMIGNYLKLSPEQLAMITSDPSQAEELAYPEDGSDLLGGLDIDKSWHLIHFLLNGEPWGGTRPLVDAVLGGHELSGTDAGYGPFRYLEPTEVESTAAALASISSEALWSRFDSQSVQAAEIYPTLWAGDEEDREYIQQNFEALRKYFSEAASSRCALLLYLS